MHCVCMNSGTQSASPSMRLEVDAVTVRFGGITALDAVSFCVPRGAIVGVIGPNGAGKTTLFNVICGFTRARSGRLLLDGAVVRPVPHHLPRLGIARTLQGLGLFPGLTVVENVMTGARPGRRTHALPGLMALPRTDRREREDRAAAMAALERLHLADVAGASPDSLPYAVAKRVALARALVARPRLLLLDEPAGGLGGDDISELAALLRTLPGDGGDTSVVLVEHHVDLVMAVCDSVVVLDFGKVIGSGRPDEVRDDPAVIEAYLGADITRGAS